MGTNAEFPNFKGDRTSKRLNFWMKLNAKYNCLRESHKHEWDWMYIEWYRSESQTPDQRAYTFLQD